MKSIVYGIVDARDAAGETLPTGLDGAELVAIEHDHLAALLSPLSGEPAADAGVDRALAYARTLERLHRRMTVLPMRYGAFVQRPEDAAEFLRRYETEFSHALEALEGCDEMGVRVLLPHAETPGAVQEDEPDESTGAPTGSAYLQRRRKFYEQQERAKRFCAEWAERVRAAFTGLFRDSSWEPAGCGEGRLLSLSFLVESSRVPAFKAAFHRFEQSHSAKAICTGPWPPYAFVAGLAKPPMAAQAEKEFLQRQKG